MLLNSRALALLLSISISVITTAFLYLVPQLPATGLLVAFGLSFSSSYLLISIVLEFLFFKELNAIYSVFEKIRKKDFSDIEEAGVNPLSPLKKINEELYSYAKFKQREIDELKKMETFRREFLADVSHELKTPIFAAQGFVHTLLDGAVEDKSVRAKFLKKAAKSLDGLDMLVHDLLTISQMETGEIKMHFEDFEIRELIAEVFEQFEDKAAKKNISLTLSRKDQNPIYVHADFHRIYQVVTNLVSNAIKYTRENGLVEVALEEGKKEITIFVKDNGAGIPPEDLKRVFERFYRVEKSRSKEKGGTGLGLSIVKHIIEAHGSKVNVTSAVGKGSTFFFKLRKSLPEDVELLHSDSYEYEDE